MIWMPPWRARSQTFLVWRLRSPASRSNSRSSLWMYTYIHTYIHAHVSLQIGDITRFIAILIGNMMTIIHWKWGCPTFTAIFWHAAVDETRRPLNQKKHVHINIHTMICYVLKSSDDEWCIFFWSPRRFAWCGLVNISDQKSCVASAALNCNQEATDSKPPPGDWAPYISHVYIYNMVIMCIFLSFFFFFFLSFIHFSLCIYIYTSVYWSISIQHNRNFPVRPVQKWGSGPSPGNLGVLSMLAAMASWRQRARGFHSHGGTPKMDGLFHGKSYYK